MLCWKCRQEMVMEFTTPWHLNKNGDKIRTGTFVCWPCRCIMKIKTAEMNPRDDGE